MNAFLSRTSILHFFQDHVRECGVLEHDSIVGHVKPHDGLGSQIGIGVRRGSVQNQRWHSMQI